MKEITQEQLNNVIELHQKWLNREDGGEKADLSDYDLQGKNLSNATLSNVNFSGSYLRNANFSDSFLKNANFKNTYLKYVNFSYSNLVNSNFSNTNLSNVNFFNSFLNYSTFENAYFDSITFENSYLCNANFKKAILNYVNFNHTNLKNASLDGAKITNTDFYRAILEGAKFDEDCLISITSITPAGTLIGWKKCENDVIVKLKIPARAKRSNATGRKCRAEYVKVMKVYGAADGVSRRAKNVIYRKGEIVKCDKWEENRWKECGGGIHFFLTRQEAENYIL